MPEKHVPGLGAIMGPCAAALNDWPRTQLRERPALRDPEPPRPAVGYVEHETRYANVGETLRQAIARNPHLAVFVANGCYDLATAYLATEHTFNHLGCTPRCAPTSPWPTTRRDT